MCSSDLEENNIEPDTVKKAVSQAREAGFQKRRRERATKKKYRYRKRR